MVCTTRAQLNAFQRAGLAWGVRIIACHRTLETSPARNYGKNAGRLWIWTILNGCILLGTSRTIYIVFIRYFLQGNRQVYARIRCLHTVLASPIYCWPKSSSSQQACFLNGCILLGTSRTIYIRYFLQGNRQIYICSYTVPTYGFGQPYILLTKEQQQPASLLFAQVFNHAIPEMNSISLRRRVLGQP